MKKTIISIIILLILVIPSKIFAQTIYTGEVTSTGGWIRTAPNTSLELPDLGQAPKGAKYTLVTNELIPDESTRTDRKCPEGWYKFYFNETTIGYFCSTGMKVTSTEVPDAPAPVDTPTSSECENEMKNAGFPSNYWAKLCALKQTHPNWKFNAIKIRDSFATAVSRESCSNSIIINGNSEDMFDRTCGKNYDSGYTGASQKAVAYYMNPLNFLTENYVFMFESSYYNSGISIDQYRAIVGNILSSMAKNIPEITNYVTNTYSVGVSPSAIATRIRQENGSGLLSSGSRYAGQLKSALSGDYTTRWGLCYNTNTKSIKACTSGAESINLNDYYNFYNVGASDGGDVTDKAMKYAYLHGWGGKGDMNTSRNEAVYLGAKYIYDAYTNTGQENIYFNKFNINPASSSLYSFQYMTNIQAAASEGNILYNGYKSLGYLSLPFVFDVPVFDGITEDISNTPGGATGDTSDSINSISISNMTLSAGYKIDGSILSNIGAKHSISEFKSRISSLGGSATIYKSGLEINPEYLGTGMDIKICNATSCMEYTALVYGDTSGDGIINALDLLQVQKAILGSYKLNGVYASAADTSHDGKVNALDLLQVQKNILGSFKIE